MQEIFKELKEIRAEIQEMRNELGRYKGFIGGAIWAVGVVSASVSAFFGLFYGNGGTF